MICTRFFPKHGDALSHVARLIDEYLVESLDDRGHLEVIRWLHEHGLDSIKVCVLSEAIAHGHLPVVKWLLQEGVKLTDYDQQQLRLAARNGHLTTVHWIHENFKDADTSYPMADAAENGDLDLLQRLHQLKRCSKASSVEVMDAAVGGGHFYVVEWQFENCSKRCSINATYQAARAGNIPMLQWLHTHCSDRFDSEVMSAAAVNGQLETVNWLHENRSEGCAANAIVEAAYEGHLDVLRRLHENGVQGWTTRAMDWAAERGNLDIVKWLHENRSEGCTDFATYDAACNGHLDVLRWLVEHYPGNCRNNFMEMAAWEGQLDVVQYLDDNTNQRASRWGLGAVAKQGWLKAQLMLMEHSHHSDGTMSRDELTAVSKAFDKVLAQLSAKRASPASLLWAEALELLESFHNGENYSCVSIMLERALRRGYLVLAQRFLGNRDSNERRKYVGVAAERENIVLLRWMIANGIPIDPSSAIEVGANRAYVEVVGYLSERDRVLVVCEATTKQNLRKLLRWTLTNTSFSDDSSYVSIYNAVKQAPSDTIQWLRGNLTDTAARKWRV